MCLPCTADSMAELSGMIAQQLILQRSHAGPGSVDSQASKLSGQVLMQRLPLDTYCRWLQDVDRQLWPRQQGALWMSPPSSPPSTNPDSTVNEQGCGEHSDPRTWPISRAYSCTSASICTIASRHQCSMRIPRSMCSCCTNTPPSMKHAVSATQGCWDTCK